MLGLHEDIQARAREELDQVFGEDEEDHIDTDETSCLARKLKTTNVTTEHMRQMKYLDRVIKESLRMWPSIPFVARQMTEDLLVGKWFLLSLLWKFLLNIRSIISNCIKKLPGEQYLIPEGATCVIFTHALHNNPKYYPKPEVFDPDRFLPENTIKRHPFAYIPFSAGPRNCIGQKFAQMEVKVILAKIIRNYYIKTIDHRDKLEVVGELVLRSRNGLNVRIIPRFS